MFLLKTENLNLELEVVPVSGLISHEATMPGVSRPLIMEFSHFAVLRHPIIIDKNNIVLDGNHRVGAFKDIGFKHIAACRIDYFNQSVKLRYWFRLVKNVNDFGVITSIIRSMGGRVDSLPTKAALSEALEKNKLCWGIQQGDQFIQIHFSEDRVSDAVDSYRVLKNIQDALSSECARPEYIPCESVRTDDVLDEIQPGDVVIWTPHIDKRTVLAAARDGKVFAPKTTRHLIPARPLNINIPCDWLKEDTALDNLNRRFTNYLAARRIREFGPGQVIEGRYYGEKLFVFYD